MLHALNDIRVLMSDCFTKEYILESLKQDKKIQTKDTLGTDQIRAFLGSLMHLIVSSACQEKLLSQYETAKSLSSIMTLKQTLSQVAQIVLNQFVAREAKELIGRASETHRILQEMLLDIIVVQLEQRCYSSCEQDSTSVMPSSSMNEIIQLLRMLSEMI